MFNFRFLFSFSHAVFCFCLFFFLLKLPIKISVEKVCTEAWNPVGAPVYHSKVFLLWFHIPFFMSVCLNFYLLFLSVISHFALSSYLLVTYNS